MTNYIITECKRVDRKPGVYGKAYKEYHKKPRIYVWPKDEHVLENLINRHFRPVTEWRKVVTEALKQLGFEGKTFKWSQKAGCGCGCSPGFVLDTTEPGFDIHLTVDKVE